MKTNVVDLTNILDEVEVLVDQNDASKEATEQTTHKHGNRHIRNTKLYTREGKLRKIGLTISPNKHTVYLTELQRVERYTRRTQRYLDNVEKRTDKPIKKHVDIKVLRRRKERLTRLLAEFQLKSEIIKYRETHPLPVNTGKILRKEQDKLNIETRKISIAKRRELRRERILAQRATQPVYVPTQSSKAKEFLAKNKNNIRNYNIVELRECDGILYAESISTIATRANTLRNLVLNAKQVYDNKRLKNVSKLIKLFKKEAITLSENEMLTKVKSVVDYIEPVRYNTDKFNKDGCKLVGILAFSSNNSLNNLSYCVYAAHIAEEYKQYNFVDSVWGNIKNISVIETAKAA
jgi:hypothetical protein